MLTFSALIDGRRDGFDATKMVLILPPFDHIPATLVACGWVGAVIEKANQAFGQE